MKCYYKGKLLSLHITFINVLPLSLRDFLSEFELQEWIKSETWVSQYGSMTRGDYAQKDDAHWSVVFMGLAVCSCYSKFLPYFVYLLQQTLKV